MLLHLKPIQSISSSPKFWGSPKNVFLLSHWLEHRVVSYDIYQHITIPNTILYHNLLVYGNKSISNYDWRFCKQPWYQYIRYSNSVNFFYKDIPLFVFPGQQAVENSHVWVYICQKYYLIGDWVSSKVCIIQIQYSGWYDWISSIFVVG